MAAPRKITDAGRKRLLAVGIARRMLPTDEQLAVECGCTVRGVQTAMQRLLELLDDAQWAASIDAIRTVSRGSHSGTIVDYPRSRAQRSLECPASPNPSRSRTF